MDWPDLPMRLGKCGSDKNVEALADCGKTLIRMVLGKGDFKSCRKSVQTRPALPAEKCY